MDYPYRPAVFLAGSHTSWIWAALCNSPENTVLLTTSFVKHKWTHLTQSGTLHRCATTVCWCHFECALRVLSHREDILYGLENIGKLFDECFYHRDIFSTLDRADHYNLLLSLIFFHPRFSVGCVWSLPFSSVTSKPQPAFYPLPSSPRGHGAGEPSGFWEAVAEGEGGGL